MKPGFNVPRYVQDGIRKAAASLQFSAQHTVDYDFRSFSTSACVAVIYQITLREEPREVTLLCKVPPADADDTVLALFEREVFVYQQLLPTFVQFQQEHDILPSAEEYIYGPACYYGHFNFQRREGLLILEDVGRRLFGNRNKFEPIDYDSGRLAMVQLGRFHAVSLALKEQHPELFARFQQLGDVSRDQVADMEGFRDTMNTSFDQAIDTLNIHETVKKEKLTKLKDSFVEELKIIADSELSEPFCVVCHGDFSACNLMYSYNVSQHQPAPNPSLIPPQNFPEWLPEPTHHAGLATGQVRLAGPRLSALYVPQYGRVLPAEPLRQHAPDVPQRAARSSGAAGRGPRDGTVPADDADAADQDAGQVRRYGGRAARSVDDGDWWGIGSGGGGEW